MGFNTTAQLPKSTRSTKKSKKKVSLDKNKLFSKKIIIPVAVLFGLVGAYFVYRSFAYTPTLAGSDGEFVTLAPARIMDTRDGNGGYRVAIPAGSTYTLQVADRGGVPSAAAVRAVVLSVVAVAPANNGYMTFFPTGTSLPTASSINYAKGQTIANQVTVRTGADGKVQIFSSASAHIVVDVNGYYSSDTGQPGSRYNPLTPQRILDTRNGIGGYSKALGPDSTYDVRVLGEGGVPMQGVSAVVVNVTAVNPTAGGFATVWPKGVPLPTASSINYRPGVTVAKLVTVPVGADGSVSIFNKNGTTNYIMDVVGYYDMGVESFEAKSQSGRFIPLTTPTRLMDTRNGTGGPRAAIPAGGSYTLQIANNGGIGDNVSAAVLNVTVVGQQGNGFITVMPNAAYTTNTAPSFSNINYVKDGGAIANQVVTAIGADDGKVRIYSSQAAHVIVDVIGYFVEYEESYTDDFYVGGYVSKMNDPNPFNTPVERSIEYDLIINELPKIGTETRITFDLRLNTTNTTYTDHRYHPFVMDYNAVNGETKITAQCRTNQDCRIVDPSLIYDKVTFGDNTNFDIRMSSLRSNNVYRISRELVQEGGNVRLHTSISFDGKKTTLFSEEFNNRSLTAHAFVNVSVYNYNCRNPWPVAYDIGNVVLDGSTDTKMYLSTFMDDEHTNGNCPGYVKLVFSENTINSLNSVPYYDYAGNSRTPYAYNLSDSSLMGVKIGINKGNRDVTKPQITYLGQEVKENGACSGDRSVKPVEIRFSVSDNEILETGYMFDAGSSGVGYSRNESVLKQNEEFRQTFCSNWYGQKSGANEITLYAKDTSGNVSELPITVTLP